MRMPDDARHYCDKCGRGFATAQRLADHDRGHAPVDGALLARRRRERAGKGILPPKKPGRPKDRVRARQAAK